MAEASGASSASQPASGAEAPMVKFGVFKERNQTFVGKTVKELRNLVSSKTTIPSDASAYKGKNKLDDSYVIQAGDGLIEFHKRQGEKGV